MVGVGSKVVVAPMEGESGNLVVLAAGGGGGNGAGGEMQAYWSGLVANLRFFSNRERTYHLTPPAVDPYKCKVEEVLQTVELTAIPESLMVPPGFVSWRFEAYTSAGIYTYKLGLAVTIGRTKITPEMTFPFHASYGCRPYLIPGMQLDWYELCQNSSYSCFSDALGYETPYYQCDDAPLYANQEMYLQAWIFSSVKLGATPGSATACIKNLVVGATSFYDQRKMTLETGTSTTIEETKIIASSESWTPGEWVDAWIEVTSGPAANQLAKITANDETTLTCDSATFETWGMVAGNTFEILG
jgi:hypothetical protein